MGLHIKFFKPFEVLSNFTDTQGRKTLKDFIDLENVYAAGRLDYRSEGLLILTDDGSLIHHLTTPKYKVDKTYLAQVEGIITEEAIQKLETEILLPQIQSKLPYASIIAQPDIPSRPTPVRDYHPTTWVKIVIQEGKKHQVRRMTAAAGFPTLRLIRVAIGPISIQPLQPGEWCYLNQHEINQLKSAVQSLHE